MSLVQQRYYTNLNIITKHISFGQGTCHVAPWAPHVEFMYLFICLFICFLGKERVMSRPGHPTLKPSASSLGIVERFAGDFQCPAEREACLVRVFSQGVQSSVARLVVFSFVLMCLVQCARLGLETFNAPPSARHNPPSQCAKSPCDSDFILDMYQSSDVLRILGQGFGRVVVLQQGESLWSGPLVDIMG